MKQDGVRGHLLQVLVDSDVSHDVMPLQQQIQPETDRNKEAGSDVRTDLPALQELNELFLHKKLFQASKQNFFFFF